MKIALLGYGKMGKLVEEVAREQGLEIGPRVDIDGNADGRGITRDSMSGVDVAIEFSQPDAVLANIKAAAESGVHIVVGTTGWSGHLESVKKIVSGSGIGLVYGSNFSLGMNLFFEIAAHAARIVGTIPQYEAYLHEEHHSAKKDAPSGTALSLLDAIRPHIGNPNPSVSCVRAGRIPGTHVVGFDSEADSILLEHRARNRRGFAEGAVLAARWIAGRKGTYDFRGVFREIIGI
jgi:4-hydroxy-tetrahydrodipicolinate reductase